MKDLYKNSGNYIIKVQIRNLSYGRPKELGYFKFTDLVKNDYDTIPLYNSSSYIIDKEDEFHQNPPMKLLQAIVDSVTIINKESKKVVVKIDFDKTVQIPESLQLSNEIDFQILPVDTIKSKDYENLNNISSILPEENKSDKNEISSLIDYQESLNRKYKGADAFDKKTIKKEIELFQSKMAQDFVLVLPINTTFLPINYNKNIIKICAYTPFNFRLKINTNTTCQNITNITFSDFRYDGYWSNSRGFPRNFCFNTEYYFYTSKEELAPLDGSRYYIEEVRLEGGSLFYEESRFTTIIMDVVATVEDIQDLYTNEGNYEIVISYKNMKYEQLPCWGFFNEDALLIANGNTDLLKNLELISEKKHTPYYFITQVKKEDEKHSTPWLLTAEWKSISVVNKKTKKVIAKAVAKEEKE